MTSHLWWYAARSGGIVAWAMLTTSVVWGLLLSGKLRPGKVRPAWILDLHRYLGALATVFTGVHVITIMADGYTDFGVADVLVPFTASWNPGAVAWGIVGLYLLAAVEATSLLRRRLSKRSWKRIHLLSFPLYVTATVHLVQAGTDAGNRVLAGSVIASAALIAGLTAWRVAGRRVLSTGGPRPESSALAASRERVGVLQ